MENYLALVAIILKAVCGLASLEGAFRCSKIKQAISTKKKITLCSLIPGMGQFVNGQAFKGIVFFAIFVLFIGQMLLGGFHALVGLVTLGSIPMEDHSLFILIEGTLQFIITIIFLIFYGLNLLDAYRVAKMRQEGKKSIGR